ncbi:MAG: carboxypeptidase-like regulatory domain-containing protein [Tunicatimonas sp.]|uniref:carboxypeptidase-like regulatory domain-containing protein n=1 Tax=Tunicatimonas sp. TaxID=1940096 RepID=UPI003C753662
MSRFLLLSLSLFMLEVPSLAQTVEGKVQNAATEEGLAYVNIGVVGKNVGTVSNQDGDFLIAIDEQYNQDTLKISMVGYQPRSFVVANFKEQMQDDPTVALTEAVATLKEVVIKDKRYRGRKLKERIIGNTKAVPTNQTYFAFNALGNEMGIFIKVKRNPTFVQNFNLFITENKYETFKFRLNFYSVKNGKPYQNLLNQNVVASFTESRGQLTVDLRDYNIMLEDDVIVTMEWIEELGEHGLAFSTGSSWTRRAIVRQTSQGNWKEGGPPIGITLKVLQ